MIRPEPALPLALAPGLQTAGRWAKASQWDLGLADAEPDIETTPPCCGATTQDPERWLTPQHLLHPAV